MPDSTTTVESRFDQEDCSKNGIFFRGSPHLLVLPREGECFDLDQPSGRRGSVVRKEIRVSGRSTEVILHCRLEVGKQEQLTGGLASYRSAKFIKALFKRSCSVPKLCGLRGSPVDLGQLGRAQFWTIIRQ